MALPSVDYTPRDPAADVLHRVVREHLQTSLAEAANVRDGEGVPRFVEEEFRAFLACGFFPPHHAQSAWRGPRLAGGFSRFQCGGCQTERLVAFSCKGRGFCPSCGGRRMTERAAHLVHHVIPDVPVRQWVLTLPHRVRYLLAWRHDLCEAVVRVLLREGTRAAFASTAIVHSARRCAVRSRKTRSCPTARGAGCSSGRTNST